MSEIDIRKAGRVGRITLNRPKALNALTWDMVREIAAILPVWAADDDVDMLVIDAEGDKAFCAGGDIAGIYDCLVKGEIDTVRQFWREEYPINLALYDFPKPVASFLQGYTMGGGVGVGCHASHRIVCENSRIAMPECGIGLVPDVGGSLLLARAPGWLGEYLGVTGYRMGPGDAILAGFADYYIPREVWPVLIERLEATGDWNEIDRAAHAAPDAPLAAMRAEVDAHFDGETLRDILNSMAASASEWTAETLAMMEKKSPLSMACAVELIHRARTRDNMVEALKGEYRFGHRIAAMDDFREGIRAAIIDKDGAPKWAHDRIDGPSRAEVSGMLLPLGPDELKLEDRT